METWDERERLRSLVDTAARALRLAEKLAQKDATPSPRTSKALLSAADQAADEVRQALGQAITVDAWRLEDLGRDAERAKEAALVTERTERPQLEPFMTLLEDVRAARRQSESFYRSARWPSEAKLAKWRSELLEYLKEMDAEYGPPSAEDYEAAEKAWDRLDRKLWR